MPGYVPAICYSCQTCTLLGMHDAAADTACRRCARRTAVLTGIVLNEGAGAWVERLLGAGGLKSKGPGPSAVLDVLRLLLSRPDLEQEDVAYLLRRIARLEDVELPASRQDTRLALQVLAAVFEGVVRAWTAPYREAEASEPQPR